MAAIIVFYTGDDTVADKVAKYLMGLDHDGSAVAVRAFSTDAGVEFVGAWRDPLSYRMTGIPVEPEQEVSLGAIVGRWADGVMISIDAVADGVENARAAMAKVPREVVDPHAPPPEPETTVEVKMEPTQFKAGGGFDLAKIKRDSE